MALVSDVPEKAKKPPKSAAQGGESSSSKKKGKQGGASKQNDNQTNFKDPNLAKMTKYQRGQPGRVNNIKDKKLKSNIKKQEKKLHDAAYKAASSELLLTEDAGYLEAEGMERTYKFTQTQLANNLDINSSKKVGQRFPFVCCESGSRRMALRLNPIFDLKLNDFGPYSINYTRNGRHLLIGGRKGHVATFDWQTGKLGCELHLKETVRDVQWLHNENMFAVAQKKYVYIYDHTGMEVHCLRKHVDVNRLEFLPYHFLLATMVRSFDGFRIGNEEEETIELTLYDALGCRWMAQVPGHVDGPADR
ncbi:hypothetical protein BC936DRAFT_145288 [Jimgerdemannia flammicorona]|uniref:WD40-repeat-containing domain protein n=1 Tax=Jimgerdemannia flammicorona TaxID=994334 RepID=A0A433DAE6_9FUNG|nr:hypothetical protein BC936DRAFT_145288 [Jimgerdemannia flammicorona]